VRRGAFRADGLLVYRLKRVDVAIIGATRDADAWCAQRQRTRGHADTPKATIVGRRAKKTTRMPLTTVDFLVRKVMLVIC
jgi:hypothetical protein